MPTFARPGSACIVRASAALSKLARPEAKLTTVLRTASSVDARNGGLTAAPGVPPPAAPLPPRAPTPLLSPSPSPPPQATRPPAHSITMP
jgi:hypothetical protein